MNNYFTTVTKLFIKNYSPSKIFKKEDIYDQNLEPREFYFMVILLKYQQFARGKRFKNCEDKI